MARPGRSDYDKKLFDRRLAAGLCADCGKQPLAEGNSKRLCIGCLESKRVKERKRFGHKEKTSASASKAHKQRAVEAGFCIVHTDRIRDTDSATMCRECLDRCAANQARYRAKKQTAQPVQSVHRARNGRAAVMQVKEVNGWWRASLGKVAWWGKTKDEAVERLNRKLAEGKAA